MDKRKLLFLFLLLFLATVLAYANSLGVPFLSDDYVWVCENKSVWTIGPVSKFFLSPAYAEYATPYNYRPLTSLSFALNYAVNGDRPAGYHVVNLLFHALNVFLVFLALRRMKFEAGPSFAGALIFAVHPIHTEAVTWISGRGNVLFLFFFLVSYVLFSKIEERPVNGPGGARIFGCRDALFLLGALAAYGLALLSKEMAITLPALLFGHDLYCNREWSLRRRLKRMWLYIPFVLVGVGYFALRTHVLGRVAQDPFLEGGFSGTFLIMLKALGVYCRVLLVPTGLSLTYHLPLSKSIFDMSVFPSFCLFVFGVVTGVATLRRSPYVSFSIFWFVMTMMPVSNIVPVNAFVAERFLYGPSIGLCILIAWYVKSLPGEGRNRKLLAGTAVTLLVFCYMLLSVSRNGDWRKPVSLWTKTIKASPSSFFAYSNLGLEHMRHNRIPEAINAFTRALELNKNLVAPHMNLAMCYERTGEVGLAISHYKKALASPILGNPAWNHYKLAGCLERNGRIREAIEHYEVAVNAKPDFAHARRRLGHLYKTRDAKRAIEHFERLLAIEPTDAGACYQLGLLYHEQGDSAAAADVLRKCLDRNPDNKLIRKLLDQIEVNPSPGPNSD